jgi:hypothetical protein
MTEQPTRDPVDPPSEPRTPPTAEQRASLEDPHDSPLHHDYLVSRDWQDWQEEA